MAQQVIILQMRFMNKIDLKKLLPQYELVAKSSVGTETREKVIP